MKNRVPTDRPIPDFTPVPRRYRHDGWTAERQRAFIAALAETGSVTHAAQRVNMAKEGAYQMRLKPGADSFRAAWATALDHGVQSLTDIAIDRARDGVPVPIFHNGEQVGERRWYNDRLLMFVLKHHMPSRYSTDLPGGTKHVATLSREQEDEERKRGIAERERVTDAIRRKIDTLRGHLLAELAVDPTKRAAWEMIVGPTDWTKVRHWYGDRPTQFADDNQTYPSTIITMAMRVDEDSDDTVSDRMLRWPGDGAD